MGAGVICAASSPPAIEVVRGCAERVGQGLLGVPRSSDPSVTDKDERFLNEARVRARARDARRGREASPADQARTSDRFRRVVRRPVHRVVAVALRRHGGALSRAPRSARTLLAPEDKFELRTSSAYASPRVSVTFHRFTPAKKQLDFRLTTTAFPIASPERARGGRRGSAARPGCPARHAKRCARVKRACFPHRSPFRHIPRATTRGLPRFRQPRR